MASHDTDERARLLLAISGKIVMTANERGSCAQCAAVAIGALFIQHCMDMRLDPDVVLDESGKVRLRAQRLIEAANVLNPLGYSFDDIVEAKRLGRLS